MSERSQTDGATFADPASEQPVAKLSGMTTTLPRYIAIEGPIGVGKTSLSRRLAADSGHTLLLEPTYDNPFLAKFYSEGRQHALSTQLYFLLKRVELLADLSQHDLFPAPVVSDFLMAKDRLFAELALDADEYKLYQQVYDALTFEAPKPDLVIYLQAPPNVLLERIQKRGIDAERHITADYLAELCDAYTRLFHFYESSPLLIVNAARIDLVNDDRQYSELLNKINSLEGIREYYNPQPALL